MTYSFFHPLLYTDVLECELLELLQTEHRYLTVHQ